MSYSLNACAQALAVHPRTILRLTTGHPNPYWADGYDPPMDIAELALILATTVEALNNLIAGLDSALDVHEAAKLLKMKEAEFYRHGPSPDWQVGRVKRYSLVRLASVKGGK